MAVCLPVNLLPLAPSVCDSFDTSSSTLASSSSLRSHPGIIFCYRSRRTESPAMRNAPSTHGDVDTASEQITRIELKLGVMDAYVIETTENKGAALLLLTDVYDYNDDANRDFAHRLARLGYNVLVPDLFHGLPWVKGRLMDEYEDWRSRHPTERVAKDVDIAVTWLKEQKNVTEIGLIGFCFGGGRVLEALARDEKRKCATAVSFYPTRFDLSIANRINVPVLFISGDMDELCSASELHRIAGLIKDSKCQIYPGRGHAFAHRPSAAEHEDADDAFVAMESWLSDKLIHIQTRRDTNYS